MAFLKKRKGAQHIDFVDTSDPTFEPERHGLSRDRADRVIHAALPDGRLINGLEVFRRAYALVGLGWLLRPTGWPLLRPLFDFFYLHFARNRHTISRILKPLLGKQSCSTDRC